MIKLITECIVSIFPAEPSGVVEKAKFKAWTGRKGISKDDAKQQYIDLAAKLAPKYA